MIDARQDLGDDVNVSGTPHCLINGHALGGNQPLAKFIALIDEEMAKAKAKIAGGMTAADYYADLVKNGRPWRSRRSHGATARVGAGARPRRTVTIVAYGGYQDPYSRKVSATLKDPRVHRRGGSVAPVPALDAPTRARRSRGHRRATKEKGTDGWKMHDLLMATPIGTMLERADLDAAGKTVGLDAKKLTAALDAGTHAAAVDADMATGTTLGFNGTPQVYVNGYPISGAQAYRKFRRLVDRAIADAQPPTGKKP